MIKKLDLEKRKSFGLLDWFGHNGEPSGAGLVGSKINELVDAINNQQIQLNNHMCRLMMLEHTEELAEEPTDPYTEQKKWVGKVCRFWDDDNTNSSCGILTSIDTETFKEPQFVCNDEYDYEHCEPVSPDDDIIYKGE